MRSVVDLPAPLGPRNPVTVPGSQRKETSLHGGAPAVALGECSRTSIMACRIGVAGHRAATAGGRCVPSTLVGGRRPPPCVRCPRPDHPALEHPSLPRRQRMLLPGELRGGAAAGAPRATGSSTSPCTRVAAGLSAFVLAADVGPTTAWLVLAVDFVLGAVAFCALWFRRAHPLAGRARRGSAASPFSCAAGGRPAGPLQRRDPPVAPPSWPSPRCPWPSTRVFPLLCPGDDYVLTELVLGVLITGFVIGWGLFVRARRQLVHSLRERAQRLEAEQRLRVEQAREAERRASRARCTTSWRTASRCSASTPARSSSSRRLRRRRSPRPRASSAPRAPALEELREVIGVLREGARASAPEPPQPTLAESRALVEESRRRACACAATSTCPPTRRCPRRSVVPPTASCRRA